MPLAVFIGAGSNLGDRLAALTAAAAEFGSGSATDKGFKNL